MMFGTSASSTWVKSHVETLIELSCLTKLLDVRFWKLKFEKA